MKQLINITRSIFERKRVNLAITGRCLDTDKTMTIIVVKAYCAVEGASIRSSCHQATIAGFIYEGDRS